MSQNQLIHTNLDNYINEIKQSVTQCIFLKSIYDFVDDTSENKSLSKLFSEVSFFHFAKQNAYELFVIELNKLFREKASSNFHSSFEKLLELLQKEPVMVSKEKIEEINSLLGEAKNLKALEINTGENEESLSIEEKQSLINSLNIFRDKYLVHNDSDRKNHTSTHYVQNAFLLLEIAKRIIMTLKNPNKSDLELALSFIPPTSFGRTKLEEVAEKFY
jgi:hypothetical protein